MEFYLFLTLLALGFFWGNYAEQRHFREIETREKQMEHIVLVNGQSKPPFPEADRAMLLVGQVVIANDYFKLIVAWWRKVFGGRIMAYENLLERGRREAVLRLKEQAVAHGATRILNVRFVTSCMYNQYHDKQSGAVEVLAYGTGVR